MKSLCFILTIILSIKAYTQVSSDTTFLKKETKNGSYNIVYIDTIKDTTILKDYSLKESSLKMYKSNLKFLIKDTSISFNHFNQISLNTSWTQIQKYKEVFYNYIPSDGLYNFGYKISDSTLISITGADIFGEIILNYKKLSKNKYQLKLLTFDNQLKTITVEIIDPKKSIALWTIKNGEEVKKQYMIVRQKLNVLPKVICHCSSGKCYNEFQFDYPAEK